MRIVYMYHAEEPENGAIGPGSLPNPQEAHKGTIPLSLMQRLYYTTTKPQRGADGPIKTTMDIRNQDVTLPLTGDTLFWCKIFEMQNFRLKQHLIKV